MLGSLRKKQAETEPQYGQSRYEIKQQTATLISIANRAEAHSTKNDSPEVTNAGEVVLARQLMAAQDEMLKAVKAACACGLAVEDIQRDMVEPVLEAAVVGDVAWLLVSQVLKSVKEGARKRNGSAVSA